MRPECSTQGATAGIAAPAPAPTIDQMLGGQPLTRDDALQMALHAPLQELLSVASSLRAQGKGSTVTFSKKVFIPLTTLCRDYCGYCTFRKDPGEPGAHFMTPDEVLALAEQGAGRAARRLCSAWGTSPSAFFLKRGNFCSGKALRARSIILP